MNRDTPEYIEAVQRVKIDFFTEHLGLDITGIIHVGANDGYEMQFYRAMGIKHLIGVEPLPLAINAFYRKYHDIPLYECALGDSDTFALFTAVTRIDGTPGDGQGSSLLEEINPHPDYDYSKQIKVTVCRGDRLLGSWISSRNFDCLVMDVQGYEMPALAGFGEYLTYFKMINVELSRVPVYKGGAPASEVEAYLDSIGFKRMSPIEDHNDVFFVRKDVECSKPSIK